MAYKVGDRVFIMDSDEHGVIVRFIDKDEVVVKMGNSQLEVYTAMLRPFTEQEVLTTPDDMWNGDIFNDEVFAKYAPEVLLCFAPVINTMGDVEKFRYSIVNTLPFRIKASIDVRLRHSKLTKEDLVINPGKAIEAGLMPFGDLNSVPEMQVTAQAHDGQLFSALVKLRAKSFFNKLMFNPVLGQEAYTYTLFNWEKREPAKDLSDDSALMPDIVISKPVKPIPAFTLTPRYEVDLHIEKLSDEHMLLGAGEMLDIQLRTFEKELDAALHRRQRSIVFIHGVGKGVLKKEIVRLLDEHPFIHHHQNANFNKYGYGAIEVVFKL